MKHKLEELYLKLNERTPAFLLLGQDYLRFSTGKDPFLSEILRKYNQGAEPIHYGQLLEGEAKNEPEKALEWMQRLCERLSAPEWLELVASFPWSGVYTSAIDVIWQEAFRTEWREIEPLYDAETRNPIDPRNRFRLHCTFLFGCVNQSIDRTTKRPPLKNSEFYKRESAAMLLAHRLPELITPLGVLVIEGYAGERDWFSPQRLFGVIDALNPGQTHLFSATEELRKNGLILELTEQGKLVLHNESLATYLLEAEQDGQLRLGEKPEQEENGRLIELKNGKILEVPLELWNRVLRSAMILDDTVLLRPSTISLDKRYSEFRKFLAESSRKPVWSGYHRDRRFAFRRDFEDRLHAEVEKKLRSNELQDEPIILHGQSGIGKSVALGALAYSIRQNKKHPVLFIERKSQNPSVNDINSFCKWAEDEEAATALIIWDGMIEHEQYYDFTKKLTRLGRKVVVVGSCYRIAPNNLSQNKKKFIEAPACLSSTPSTKNEISRFIDFINEFNFEPSLGKRLKKWIDEDGERFLVALYRILPGTRSQIRLALDYEVRFFDEKGVTQIAKTEVLKRKTVLELVLAAAILKNKPKWITAEDFNSSEVKNTNGQEETKVRKLIGLVVVPGRFDIEIPLEILMRTLGKEGSNNFVETINQINTDIIQWHQDENGNILIGTRTRLEAQLITDSLFRHSARDEVEYAKELLINVRDRGSLIGKIEINFAVNLVRNMGPNGEYSKYFEDYFQDLSTTLSRLREDHSVQNHRLMLQEATLLREAARRQSDDNPQNNIEEILDKAEIVLRDALDLLGSDQEDSENNEFINKQRSRFLVELASVIGTKLKHILKREPKIENSTSFFDEIKEIAFQAFSLDPESYYPIDVLSWTTESLLEKTDLDLNFRAEISADILHAFTIAGFEDFDAIQQQNFLRRRRKIANLLNRQDLSEDSFQSLLELNPSAAHYLKAYEMLMDEGRTEETQGFSLLQVETNLNVNQRERCQTVVKYLQDNIQAISQDGRCLYLLLRVWWLSKAGQQLSYGKRQTIPFTKKDWQDCLKIVQAVMATSEFESNPSLTYLSGLCYFHIDQVPKALDIFKELENEWGAGGSRRIKTSHLASTENGIPIEYSGRVERRPKNPRHSGELYVEKLRIYIKFIPQEFGRPDIQSDELLPKFHIAFNFIGPIAERTERYSSNFSEKGKL